LRRERTELLLVCSAGGHLLQLLALKDAWEGLSRVWVCDDASDARSLLRSERVVYAFGPPNRSPRNVLRNILLAVRLVARERPRVVLTTGAGTAVPFAWAARLVGARIVYVESLSRIDGPSLACRLIAPIAERVYVQWPELAEAMPRARYFGTVLPG
jgi:UDP-N-acetylglucosamine:LPS N-acetylglucosamine transferase